MEKPKEYAALSAADQAAWDANLAKLPTICYAPDLLRPSQLTLIKRGVYGYWRSDFPGTARMHNERLEVTPAQMLAMRAGSMWGWHLGLADPETYENVTAEKAYKED